MDVKVSCREPSLTVREVEIPSQSEYFVKAERGHICPVSVESSSPETEGRAVVISV